MDPTRHPRRPAARLTPRRGTAAAWGVFFVLAAASPGAVAEPPQVAMGPLPASVGLTPQQQQKLSALEAASRAKADCLFDQIRGIRGKLFDLYGNYRLDANAAAGLDRSLNRVQEQLLALRLSEQQQLRAILSASQFARLQAAIREHDDPDDGHPHGRGDGDHDGVRHGEFP